MSGRELVPVTGFRRRNVYLSLGVQWLSALAGIASSIFVARMMLPAELGIFTVTMAFSTILSTIQTAGSTDYLLYAPSVDRDHRRSLYTLTMLLTLAVVLTLILGRPFWIAIFGESGVADVAVVIAAQMFIWAQVMPIHGMLLRMERLDLISLIALVQNLTLSLLQVVLVWLGFSYMGLAYAAATATAVGAIGYLIAAGEFAVFAPRVKELGSVFLLSGKLFVANSLSVLNNNAAQILIGGASNVGTAALFGRANMIGQIYSQTISRAIDPLVNARLAASRRDGGGAQQPLARSSGILITASLAFFGFVAICSDLIVPLVFGSQWAPAAPAMRILALAYIAIPLTSPTAALLLSHGDPLQLIRLRAVNLAARVVGILLLLPYGLTAVAIGVAASIYVNLAQSLYAIRSIAEVRLRPFLLSLVPNALCAAIPLCITLMVRLSMQRHGMTGWSLLLVSGGAMAFFQAVSLMLFRHPLWQEFRSILLRALMARRTG